MQRTVAAAAVQRAGGGGDDVDAAGTNGGLGCKFSASCGFPFARDPRADGAPEGCVTVRVPTLPEAISTAAAKRGRHHKGHTEEDAKEEEEEQEVEVSQTLIEIQPSAAP